ncbi:malonyl-CoA decarboxylase [Ramlibacter alkalitolerans]|uniref:Malonyl-CoA decarboxylase n=1 Tax=Ramlibacter alkalitolerans TaxID=2039631 RepID=A0ABS1JQY9_9BURK|nr:malonyl-CoA decarboxylase [Ramlibacter alkalitolerans]MBL0425985.1 malonyl-CoA decarboxylase [Ramlibacter alkalitolerans]
MSPVDWISRGIALWRPGFELRAAGGAAREPKVGASSPAPATPAAPAGRSTRERLQATLRRGQEALSPRVLRRTLAELQAVVDPRVSEVEGGRRARDFALWYRTASVEQRRDAWLLMSEHFGPDPKKITAARGHYEAAQGTPEEGAAEIRLRRALLSPRARLMQRFAAFPEGMRFLVDLRAELLPQLKSDKRLLPLDAELETLFSTWFDVAFLELRRLSWDSPASLLEKLIKYEAVHDIRSWADLKNRLDSDRRCYGFFHPKLDGDPLIFVEVALTDSISDSITPLLDETAAAADLSRATTAIFYSISNCQTGLRGVSFGDSLIKRVVETLQEEFPRLKTFCTLSPIPGLRAWLARQVAPEKLAAWDKPLELGPKSPERQELLSWAARYLGGELHDGKPLDPVARFHLGNGARVERLNWAGDPSAKGLKQSFGLMVNYLYDIRRLDKHRTLLSQGEIPMSAAIEDLYR